MSSALMMLWLYKNVWFLWANIQFSSVSGVRSSDLYLIMFFLATLLPTLLPWWFPRVPWCDPGVWRKKNARSTLCKRRCFEPRKQQPGSVSPLARFLKLPWCRILKNLSKLSEIWNQHSSLTILLAPTGALIVMMVYYISAAAPTFSDFHSVPWCNWCYKCHSKSLKKYQCNWCH